MVNVDKSNIIAYGPLELAVEKMLCNMINIKSMES